MLDGFANTQLTCSMDLTKLREHAETRLALVALLLGSLLMAVNPGPLKGESDLVVWAVFSGCLVAACVASLIKLAGDLVSVRARLQRKASRKRLAAISIAFAVVGGLAIYLSRPTFLAGRQDVPLPYLNIRIGLVYGVAVAWVTIVVALLTSIRTCISELGLTRGVGGQAGDDLLADLLKLRELMQRVFVGCGIVTGLAVVDTAAYGRLLSSSTGIEFSPGLSLAFGVLVAVVLMVLLQPAHRAYAAASESVARDLVPMPIDVQSWKDWAEERASVEALLGLGVTGSNAIAISFAVFSPLLVGTLATFFGIQA